MTAVGQLSTWTDTGREMAETDRGATACPACGSGTQDAGRAWRFVNSRGETEWLKCPSCQSYFMDGGYDMEGETSHTQQMTWGDAQKGRELNEFKQRMYQSILQQLCSRIDPQGRTLLDVGCAYGGFLKAAQNAGFEAYGVDIVPEAVAYVQSQGLPAQRCGRVRDLTLRSELFDVISVLDANFYWPDQPQELADIFDRLKPGGLLAMRVVDKSWMATVGAALHHLSPERGQRVLRRAVNDHRFSMPVGSFLKVLQKAGFRVISATPKGAVHSHQSSLPVRMSFAMGTALWHTLGVFLAPGAVVIAERPC